MRYLLTVWFFLSAPAAFSAEDYVINTVAGSSWVGDGGPAILALLFQAEGIAADSNANVYIADATDNRVRKISPDGSIQTVAGTGTRGFSGDGGPAAAAQLNSPYGLAIDASGNLYIADLGNSKVRRVAPDSTVQTVATLNAPRNLALDRSGNLYISDFNAHRVYRLGTDGGLSIVAGTGTAGYSGDGGPAARAELGFPAGLAIDAAGSLYIGDTQNHAIRKVSGGVVSTYARGITATGLAFDSSGKLYAADPLGGQIVIVPLAGLATSMSLAAQDLAFSRDSNLYLSSGDTVRRIGSSGGYVCCGWR